MFNVIFKLVLLDHGVQISYRKSTNRDKKFDLFMNKRDKNIAVRFFYKYTFSIKIV